MVFWYCIGFMAVDAGGNLILIEHLEGRVSRWVLEEYLESSRVALDYGLSLIVTGVRDAVDYSRLSVYGLNVSGRHAWEICDLPGSIVLDLWASKDLDPVEVYSARCFIIGGIMGDQPPRGRGLLLTRNFDWASFRRLGSRQLSVDGVVKVLALMSEGRGLDDIKFIDNPVFEVDTGYGVVEVELPFTYPVRGGRPWVSGGLVRLLSRGILWEEL